MKKVHAEVNGHTWCGGRTATKDKGFLMTLVQKESDWSLISCNRCRALMGKDLWFDPKSETISVTRDHLRVLFGVEVSDMRWADILKTHGTGVL